MAAHPEVLEQSRTDMRHDGWYDEGRLEYFLTGLGEGATATLFRRTGCGAHLARTEEAGARAAASRPSGNGGHR